MYHLRKLKSLLLLLLVAVSVRAQISEGNVYNFVNVGNNTQSMVIAANNFVSIATTNTNDYDQLWYVSKNSDNSYSLRNLGSGRYLRSSNAASVKWTMVKEDDFDANCKFNCTAAGSGYTLRATNTTDGGHYMHYGANDGGVVGWSTNADATQWTIQEVGIDSDVLEANWNELESIDPSAATVATYQTILDNLFTDKACTEKKKSSLSASDYQGLPEALQEMVLKVYNNSWAENNYDNSKSGWSAEYAQKYRVQLYEPYNEPEAAASALGINAHTNLNNPTGIFANDREALYVMVGGTIKEGASLYIASYTGNGEPGGYAEGVELKQGLNVVPSFGDGNNYVINYVVHTFDTSDGKKGNAAKARRLSAYDDLKIHIEGGYINGYWNKMGDALYTPDTHTNWDYIENRATQTTVTILGEYITLQFPLRDEDAVENNGTQHKGLAHYLNQVDVNKVIDEWDNIMMWQRFMLGVLDEATTKDPEKNAISPYSDGKLVVDYTGSDAYGYSDYYNVHGLSLGVGYNYMFGGWRHCGYNYNTMESIIVNMLTSAGSHWGPGHEIGHQHQGLLNLNGLTEVTNNLFSNVVLWYFGETTSRVNGDEGSLSNVLAAFNAEGSDFYTNNIWAQTHLYYKLFLYYHVLGHNNKFYPRLFEMLRQEPMKNGGQIDGATSLLHFYKKCCEAAEEDLTEFFRAYGFFRVMTNRYVNDYSSATYNMTQAQIEAAIAEVKALKYEENIAVLFINDATGETIMSHKGDNLELYGETRVCAELGGYASFNANTAPNYTYTVSGNTVTMTGEGGTGFAIFNEKGELIAFSDKKTFTISDECAVALASGKAEVKAVQADNTIVEATDVMDTDNTEAKYAALGELLTAAADLLAFSDADNSKPGFYKASVMQTLQQLYTEAQSVYNNKEVSSYATAYAALYQEYIHIATLETDKTPFLPGSTYVLTNKKYPTTAMTLSDNGMMCVYNNSSSAQQWTFEATDEKDIYYLKNGSNYLGSLLQSTQVGVTAKETASRYKLFDLGKGLWALQCQNDSEELQSLHCNTSYKIVGWSHTSTDNDGSWWYLTATAKDESMLPLYDLQNLIAKTEALVDEMATVQGKGTAVELTAENITSNATEDGHEPKYLLDGNAGTYFHTVWASSSVGEPHYLQVDLGEGKSLSEFVWTYTTYTTTWNADLPATVKITGSVDNQLWSDIATLTDLPSTKGTDYESATLGSSNQNFRYLRFAVTATSTGGKVNNQYYFGLGEMGLTRMSTFVEAIDDKYSNFISAAEVATVCDQIYAARQACASGTVTSEDLEALQEQYDILLAAYNNSTDEDFANIKSQLFDLLGDTESLMDLCGTVTPIVSAENKVKLQTTNASSAYYVSTNAQSTQEGPISGLVDGKYGSSYTASQYYFHTDYSGNNSTDGLDHHITISLGEGNAVSKFKFQYWNRTNTDGNYIAEMKIYGKKGDGDYTLITTLNDMPKSAGSTYESAVITCAEEYDYLRFMVTKNSSNNSKGGHPITHMAEFELTVITPNSYEVELKETAGDASVDQLLATYKQYEEAYTAYLSASTVGQVQTAIDKLAAAKEALSAAMQTNNKAALRELVARATALIDECATVTYRANEEIVPIVLQATNANGANYLSCPNLYYNPGNADSDTNCADLLDGDITSYIHTNYNAATTTYPHYLQVTFGANEVPEQFKFTYTTRSQGANQVPKKMRVEGSIDGTNYVVLNNYSYTDSNNPLPTTAGAKWTASEYLKGYAYLRFYVTMSPAGQQGAMNTTKPYFAMSEFGIEQPPLPSGYVVTWNEGDHGTATDEMVIAAYEARNAANVVLRATATVEDIAAAEATLREHYNALNNAKNPVQYVDFAVSSNVASGGVVYGGQSYTDTQVLNAPSTLSIGDLSAINLDGYTEGVVTMEGTTITVTYNKIYTVQVVGVADAGGVVFGDNSYAHGQDLNALNLTVSNLTAIDVAGYVAQPITINENLITVIYNKVYTIYINGGEGNGRITFDGTAYANEGTFNVRQGSFTATDLTASDVEGYNKSAVSVNHETGIISVSYTLDRTALENLIGETNELMQACQVFVNSAYVTNDLMISTSNAIGIAQDKLAEEDLTYAEYTEAVAALQTAYSTLNTAKGNAENEVAARNQLKEQLNTLIGETETLIASCYENGALKYVNSDYVTEASIAEIRSAIETAQAKCNSNGTTESEYTESLEVLGQMKVNLATAIGNANNEAAARDEKRAELNTLIGETETLIASCYDNGELKYVNSDYVTEASIAEIRSAIETAQVKCNSNGTTEGEYTESLETLGQMKSNLATAIENANNEAAARNEKRAELNTLINNTNALITLCGTTPGDATDALINEVSDAVASAQTVTNNMGSTVEQLTNATTTLQGQYNVLLAAQQSTAKTELRALIEQTTELIAQCGTVEYTTTIDQVALQTGDQNADFWLSTNAQEPSEGAIANLVGIVDDDGFFHSSWSAQVGAAHYLQVDMGAEHALKEFAFSYTTRDNNAGGPHPSIIVVSGSNSTSNDSFVELATINSGLPTNGNTAWNENNENVITASEAYRYLRFTVTASAGTNGCSHGNGEYYFAMARFSLNSISRGYTAELQNTNVTAEQLIEVYQANAAAATLADNSAVQADLIAEKDKLQALYDALLEAATSVQLPVTLTTDANAPVLYVIKTKRDNNPVLQYDESSEMFSVTTAVAGRATQAFYFMKGNKVEGTQQVYIYPYMAEGKVLAANNVDDGAGKAFAMDKGTATYEQWVFVERADGYYNLQPAGTTTYLSNIYGTSSKMGFYSSNPAGDEGSLLMFEATTVEGGYYYLKLKDYYETRVKVASSEIQGGTAVGYYPEKQAEDYNAAYAAATAALANTETTEAQYQTAYTNLVAANKELELIMPSADKYYRFVSVVKGNGSDEFVYADPADNKMHWSKKGTSDATAIWTITPSETEGMYNVTNLHTGSSINGFISYNPSPLNETAGNVSIVSLSGDGQVGIKCNGTMMHTQGNGAVVHWETGADDGSAWRIVEVTNEELSLVEFALTIGKYRHAGLYLNYAAVIPDGVKVYIAHTPDGQEGTIFADELDGKILPARTAVIVKGDADDYIFKYTAEEYDGTNNLNENLLGGSAYLKYQQVEETGNRCCVFGQKGGEVGLYKNWVQYVDANGSTTKTEGEGESAVTTNYAGTDDGTHFKISANKIYYEYALSTVAGATAFTFRYNSNEEGGATTELNGLTIDEDTIIYNLYGQRLLEVVEPGIYIINGKKVYVTEKMIRNND